MSNQIQNASVGNHFIGQAQKYQEYEHTPRGKLRNSIIQHQLSQYIRETPLAILDIGCGIGTLAIGLAKQGHEVTAIDSALDMIEFAQKKAKQEKVSIQFFEATVEELLKRVQKSPFDIVLCHSVLEFLPNLESALAVITQTLKPHGLISIETKNSAASVLYNALVKHDFIQAKDALDTTIQRSHLIDTSMKSFNFKDLEETLKHYNFIPQARYGVRIFSDYLPDSLLNNEKQYNALRDLELAVGSREPYSSCGRYLHYIGKQA